MKKFIFAAIIIAMTLHSVTAFAGGPENLSATNANYPGLYTNAYCPDQMEGGKKIHYVTQTIPFSMVSLVSISSRIPGEDSVVLNITHPIPGSESEVVTSTVIHLDDDGRTKKIFELLRKHPEAISRFELSIKLTYVDGVTNGVWKVHSEGWPNNLD